MEVTGFKVSWEPLSGHMAGSGDLAYLVERNAVTVNNSLGHPITTHGKSVTVWREDAKGQWKNVVDIWNDEPATSR